MNKALLRIFASVALSALFLLIFSFAASPLWAGKVTVFDSEVYKAIGKGWSQGLLPYTEMWDHKGVLVYAICALSYLVFNNSFGIFLIELACLSTVCYYGIKLYESSGKTLFHSILLLMPSIAVLIGIFCGGNTVEEFIIPFMAIMVYVVFKWGDRVGEQYTPFPTRAAALTGIIVGIGFLSRLTNGLGACGILGAGLIIMLINRDYKHIWRCIFAAICGFLLPVVPFYLYFLVKGGISEMFYASFLYNILYSTSASAYSLSRTISHLIQMAPVIVAAAVSILYFWHTRRWQQPLLWFLGAVFTALWILPSRHFLKYNIVALPFIPIILIFAGRIIRGGALAKRILTLLCILVMVVSILYNMRYAFPFPKDESQENCVFVERVRRVIPPDEMNSVLAYSLPASFYLNMDILPPVRYFVLQEFHASQSEKVRKEIYETLEHGNIKWIVATPATSQIDDILSNRYTVVDTIPFQSEQVSLYRLIE